MGDNGFRARSRFMKLDSYSIDRFFSLSHFFRFVLFIYLFCFLVANYGTKGISQLNVKLPGLNYSAESVHLLPCDYYFFFRSLLYARLIKSISLFFFFYRTNVLFSMN